MGLPLTIGIDLFVVNKKHRLYENHPTVFVPNAEKAHTTNNPRSLKIGMPWDREIEHTKYEDLSASLLLMWNDTSVRAMFALPVSTTPFKPTTTPRRILAINNKTYCLQLQYARRVVCPQLVSSTPADQSGCFLRTAVACVKGTDHTTGLGLCVVSCLL